MLLRLMLFAASLRGAGALARRTPRNARPRSSQKAPRAQKLTPQQLAAAFGERLLFADNHVLCVNKPAGVLSQGDRTGDPSINEYARAWLAAERGTKYAAAAHRLDRPASGALLVSASSKAHARLSKALAEDRVDKCYLAVVAPPADFAPEAHFVDAMKVVEDGRSRATEVARLETREAPPGDVGAFERAAKAKGDGWKLALTAYRVLAMDGRKALLEVSIATGRRHQIRAALASAGAPILGDAKYGPREAGGHIRPFVALHCVSLDAPHPIADKPRIKVTAPLPEVWHESYDSLADAAERYRKEI